MFLKINILAFVLLVSSLGLYGQTRFFQASLPIEDALETATDTSNDTIILSPFDLPWLDYQPFLSVTLEVTGVDKSWMDQQQWAMRFQYPSGAWGPWMTTSRDEHAGDGLQRHFTHLHYQDPGARAVQVRVILAYQEAAAPISGLTLHLFDPGPSGVMSIDEEQPASPRNTPCTCIMPTLTSRQQWCPDGSCFPHPTPEMTTPTHLIIHHSAGSNSSSDWAAVVRSIWNFHVNSNGWSDVGYNWLIDPNGIIYIGRGDGILGAHFCAKNGATLGTCVLGNFTTEVPTPTAINALTDLYAWKSCEESIPPLDSSFHEQSNAILPNIAGHRDGCNTSCPGNAFYPMLPQVRQAIAGTILEDCTCHLAVATTVQATTQANAIHISWSEVAGDAVTYQVERKGPFDADFIYLDSTSQLIFIDESAAPGTNYAYRIRAVNEFCFSDPSTEASASITPQEAYSVRPTLVNDLLFVQLYNPDPGPVDVRIYAMDGRLVFQREYSKPGFLWEAEIKVHFLSDGVYVLVVKQGGERKVSKVVKY